MTQYFHQTTQRSPLPETSDYENDGLQNMPSAKNTFPVRVPTTEHLVRAAIVLSGGNVDDVIELVEKTATHQLERKCDVLDEVMARSDSTSNSVSSPELKQSIVEMSEILESRLNSIKPEIEQKENIDEVKLQPSSRTVGWLESRLLDVFDYYEKKNNHDDEDLDSVSENYYDYERIRLFDPEETHEKVVGEKKFILERFPTGVDYESDEYNRLVETVKRTVTGFGGEYCGEETQGEIAKLVANNELDADVIIRFQRVLDEKDPGIHIKQSEEHNVVVVDADHIRDSFESNVKQDVTRVPITEVTPVDLSETGFTFPLDTVAYVDLNGSEVTYHPFIPWNGVMTCTCSNRLQDGGLLCMHELVALIDASQWNDAFDIDGRLPVAYERVAHHEAMKYVREEVL